MSVENKIMANKIKTSILLHYVEVIKNVLDTNALGTIKFFIAGGSVSSILTGSEKFNDVDVYFSNKEDVNRIKHIFYNICDMDTQNALTFKRDNINLFKCTKYPLKHDIQFVIGKYGTPKKIFEDFDFNCSKCAFTDEMEYIIDDTFDTNISISDYKNITHRTLSRYNKYTSQKGFKDKSKQTLRELYSFYLKKYDDIFGYYYDYIEITGLDVIKEDLQAIQGGQGSERSKLAYNLILQEYSGNERLKIFEAIPELLVEENIEDICDDFILARVARYRGISFATHKKIVKVSLDKKVSEIVERRNDLEYVKRKYPEYLI